MRARRVSLVLGAVVMVALLGSSAGGATAAGVVNLGYPASFLDVVGERVVFAAQESGQGADLNGDGDQTDPVIFVHDATTATTTSLRLSAFAASAAGDLVAFDVWEGLQGSDLNGDGDLDDAVVHVHDNASGATANTRIAGAIPTTDGRRVAFVAGEQAAGADLNGDGDALDNVVHVYDATTGAVANTGLASFGVALAEGGYVYVRIDERSQGGRDLNGDGDALDLSLHVINSAGIVRNLGLSTFNLHVPSGQRVAFAVAERAQGGRDLNGDGDANDPVLHVYDAATETVTNVGVAADTISFRGSLVAFTAFEQWEQADLNGDGDATDLVVHAYDLSSGELTNLRLATFVLGGAGPETDGTVVAVPVPESAQGGVDLNGDGDAGDQVVHIFDAASRESVGTGLAGGDPRATTGSVGFIVPEPGQGRDLNGDGDMSDLVAHVVTAGTITNLGLASTFTAAGGGMFTFAVGEAAQGRDLDGDGDLGDVVPHSHEVASGRTVNLGISARPIVVADGRRIAFDVPESTSDLNGDGDVGDVVVHTYAPQEAASDTSEIRAAVEAAASSSYRAPGVRQAMLSRLAGIDLLIEDGRASDARAELESLRRRIDGCGTAADANDWIVVCSVQISVRGDVDDLLRALATMG